MNANKDFEKNQNLEKNSKKNKDYLLILHNDNVNDFAHVIDSLIEVCDHDSIQAEQCAYIVHYCGECDITTGKQKQLKTMYNKLIEKGLTVSIN